MSNEPTANATGTPPARSGPYWARAYDVVGKAVFEILIVAVGVLLALAVEEWREESQQEQLADHARSTLRAEILANREAVFKRHRRIAELYALVAANPERVGEFVFDRRNRALLLNDSAWIMAVETGALRWLSNAERASVAEVYASHQRLRDVTGQEMTKWSELAAFDPEAGSPEATAARNRAIRIWQAYALRVQLAHCATAGRYEQALGARLPHARLVDFCAGRRPDESPETLYAEWYKRGWASPVPPRFR